MKRSLIAASAVVALLSAGAGTAMADASNPNASCEAILVSSATYPGEVADLGRALHDALKAQGIPPGFLDVGAAQLKEGSIPACLAALGLG
jgi:hypothetical protein